MSRAIIGAVVALLISVVSAEAAFSPDLAQPSQDWARLWQARNLDAVLALYTDDAVFMVGDGSQVEGKPALRKFFATVLSQYRARPQMRSLDSMSSGDLGYDWGDYTEIVTPIAKPAAVISTHGTYLVILRRVSGHWLIARQTWTGSTPVPVKR